MEYSKYKQYTLYKGEEVIAFGTATEIAEQMNITIETVKFYKTPSNAARDKGNKRILVES